MFRRSTVFSRTLMSASFSWTCDQPRTLKSPTFFPTDRSAFRKRLFHPGEFRTCRQVDNVCMYVRMYLCMHAFMYVCKYSCIYVLYVFVYVCIYVGLICMYFM